MGNRFRGEELENGVNPDPLRYDGLDCVDVRIISDKEKERRGGCFGGAFGGTLTPNRSFNRSFDDEACLGRRGFGPRLERWLELWIAPESTWKRCSVGLDRAVMHREVRSHAALPPPLPTGSSGDPLLMGHLQLPPSIPVSKDGEEGAYAYHLGLLHSNAGSRPERYHAPPNRTLDPRGQNDDLGFHSHYVTSTTTKSPLSSSSSSSGGGTADSKALFQTSESSYSTSGDSSAPHSYGGAGKRLPPHVDKLPLWGSHEGMSVAGEKGFKRETVEEKPPVALAAALLPKQRSSSAEGVRRIISKYSFLRNFSRKHTSTKTSGPVHSSSAPQAPPPPPLSDPELCGLVGVSGVLSEAGSPPVAEKQAPWELPPNYVDMIFIKDAVPSTAVGGKKQSDAGARKQLHLKQHLLEQQQHQLNKSAATEKSQTTTAVMKQK